ncbi:MAG: hypothetical protein IPH37_11460 [Burkholderiales bacterium]|nr:hypothetical protein [Burkholderiales bacterium]
MELDQHPEIRQHRGIGTSVWRKVRAEVTKAYPQQPQYGALPSAGHIEGGDYLFFSAKP